MSCAVVKSVLLPKTGEVWRETNKAGGGPVLTPNFCLAHDMQHFSNHVILHTTLVTLHRFQ